MQCNGRFYQKLTDSVSVQEKGHANKLDVTLAGSTQYFHYTLSLAKKKLATEADPRLLNGGERLNRVVVCCCKLTVYRRITITYQTLITICN